MAARRAAPRGPCAARPRQGGREGRGWEGGCGGGTRRRGARMALVGEREGRRVVRARATGPASGARAPLSVLLLLRLLMMITMIMMIMMCRLLAAMGAPVLLLADVAHSCSRRRPFLNVQKRARVFERSNAPDVRTRVPTARSAAPRVHPAIPLSITLLPFPHSPSLLTHTHTDSPSHPPAHPLSLFFARLSPRFATSSRRSPSLSLSLSPSPVRTRRHGSGALQHQHRRRRRTACRASQHRALHRARAARATGPRTGTHPPAAAPARRRRRRRRRCRCRPRRRRGG